MHALREIHAPPGQRKDLWVDARRLPDALGEAVCRGLHKHGRAMPPGTGDVRDACGLRLQGGGLRRGLPALRAHEHSRVRRASGASSTQTPGDARGRTRDAMGHRGRGGFEAIVEENDV
eukprot:679671-Pyramimonas_sp.AAC.2